MNKIGKEIKTGIFYSAISKYSNIVVSIIIGATLARLLTPEEFGIVAIISVFTSFFNLLSNFGISPAIVQHKSLSDDDISSIFSLTILLGLFFSLLFFFIAPLIADFYNNEILINLSRLMAIAIFFNAIQIVPNALNLKMLRFKQIGIITVITHLISGVIAIILAYFGFSYYALVINSILSGIFIFIAYYYLAPIKPSLFINISSVKKIARFSTFQFFFRFINYFAVNADNLLIGKFFSPALLGFYDKAYKLMLMPVQNLTFVITPVLHPVLSKYQDNPRIIYDAYYKIVKLLSIIGFPVSIYLFFNAAEIINLIYGNQWGESVPVFRLLALSVGIQIILSSTGSIFQATNRTDLLFYSGFIGAILLVGGIFYGIFIGKSLIAVGIGIDIAFVLNALQAFYLLIKHSLKQNIKDFLGVFTFPIILSISVFLVLWIISIFNINNYLIAFLVKTFLFLFTSVIITYQSKSNWDFTKEYMLKLIKK